MRITMNYLNENNKMETVDVLGYVNGCSEYCEVYTEEKGQFIVPTKDLYSISGNNHVVTYGSGYAVKDNSGRIVSEYKPFENIDELSSNADIHSVLDRIINN